MPSRTNPMSFLRSACALRVLLCVFVFLVGHQALSQPTRAAAVPLLLPSGIAFDASGNLFLSESAGHQVRMVSPAGTLTTYAGTGVQGFSGDGGPATLARLNSPAALAIAPGDDLYLADTHNHRIRRISAATGIIATVVGNGLPGSSPDGTSASAASIDLPSALAFDSAGDLFFADARTHRIRRVDATTGTLTTVAGNGTQGFAGDGGLALAASFDSPSGLAVDASGAIYVADSRNNRVRRIDGKTHLITTVAGTGAGSFSGDGSTAKGASLHLPRGLTLDSAGNLFISDSRNERIRRIDATTGQIRTIAGGAAQTFAGDGAPAVSASLDTPRTAVLNPEGLVTLADTGNGRIRQIDAAGVIHTLAGLGDTSGSVLTLAAPSTIAYGTGSVVATLSSSPATGSVTFLETVSGQAVTLASLSLNDNAAALSTALLSAGTHMLSATYAGDSLHSAARTQVLSLTVAPASLLATPSPVSILYGQATPALNATLTGLLPADTTKVTLVLGSAATARSAPAAYPITGSLRGAAAANYTLTVAPATVTVAKAPSSTTLQTSGSYSAQVSSTTSGTPTGSVSLLDSGQPVGFAPITAGFAVFSPALTTGSHSLSAVYSGDADFLPSGSSASVVSVNPGPAPDFTLVASGQAQTISAGSAASFVLQIGLLNGGPSSAIQLSANGLPAGATASFNPAYIPPGGAVTSTILTIQTAHAAMRPLRQNPWIPVFALLLPFAASARRRRSLQRRCLVLLVGLSLFGMVGCGDRISKFGQTAPAKPYSIVVTGTATSASGAVLQHSAQVTLSVQ